MSGILPPEVPVRKSEVATSTDGVAGPMNGVGTPDLGVASSAHGVPGASFGFTGTGKGVISTSLEVRGPVTGVESQRTGVVSTEVAGESDSRRRRARKVARCKRPSGRAAPGSLTVCRDAHWRCAGNALGYSDTFGARLVFLFRSRGRALALAPG